MSTSAMLWAWDVPGLSANDRYALLALAAHHNEKTGRCDPTVRRLMERTGLGQRTVRRSLAALAKAGLIVIDGKAGARSAYALMMNGTEETPACEAGVEGDGVCLTGSTPLPVRQGSQVSGPACEADGNLKYEKKDPLGGEMAGSKDLFAAAAPTGDALAEGLRGAFAAGLAGLMRLTGRSEQASRPVLGKLRQAARDDLAAVLDAIQRAEELRPAEPVAWLLAAVKVKSPKPPAALPEVVGEWRVAAVVEKVFAALGSDERRLPDLPAVVVELLRDGHDRDEMVAKARSIAARGVEMRTAAYYRAAVRGPASDRVHRAPVEVAA